MSNTRNKSFLLVGEHGTIQAKKVFVDFTPKADGFMITFDKDSKIIKDFININVFFDYAEKQKLIMHFRTSIYNMDISAHVIVVGIDGHYDTHLSLETVKKEDIRYDDTN
jgi:hypothetical protein